MFKKNNVSSALTVPEINHALLKWSNQALETVWGHKEPFSFHTFRSVILHEKPGFPETPLLLDSHEGKNL